MPPSHPLTTLLDLSKPTLAWLVRRGLLLLSGVLGAGVLELEEPGIKVVSGIVSLAAFAGAEWLMRKHTKTAVRKATELSPI